MAIISSVNYRGFSQTYTKLLILQFCSENGLFFCIIICGVSRICRKLLLFLIIKLSLAEKSDFREIKLKRNQKPNAYSGKCNIIHLLFFRFSPAYRNVLIHISSRRNNLLFCNICTFLLLPVFTGRVRVERPKKCRLIEKKKCFNRCFYIYIYIFNGEKKRNL